MTDLNSRAVKNALVESGQWQNYDIPIWTRESPTPKPIPIGAIVYSSSRLGDTGQVATILAYGSIGSLDVDNRYLTRTAEGRYRTLNMARTNDLVVLLS